MILRYNKFGVPPPDIMHEIYHKGGATIYTDFMAFLAFPRLEINGENVVRVAKEPSFVQFVGLIFPKHSSYSAMFDDAVLRLSEGGIIKKIILSYIPPKYLGQPEKQEKKPEPFKMRQFLGGFFVWIIGMSLACISFGMEHVRKLSSSEITQ